MKPTVFPAEEFPSPEPQPNSSDTAGQVTAVAVKLGCFPSRQVFTVVDGENLATVHLDEAAERKLCVIDAQLLGRLKGDALHNKDTQHEGPPEEELTLHGVTASRRRYLVMVVVNKSSYHIGFAEVELLQLSGRV